LHGGVQSWRQLYNTGYQQDRRPVRLFHCHHSLRGSASPVLTATGFGSGRWQFSTPQNPHPLTDHQKNFASDYVGDPYGCAKFGANQSTGGEASGHHIDIQAM